MLRASYDVGVLAQGFGYTAVQEYILSLSRRGCVRGSYSAECGYLQCCAPTLMQMIASGFGACGFRRWSRQGASALRIGGWQPTCHSQSDVQNCIEDYHCFTSLSKLVSLHRARNELPDRDAYQSNNGHGKWLRDRCQQSWVKF